MTADAGDGHERTTPQSEHRWYEFKVISTVEYKARERSVTDTALHDVESAWVDDKEIAVNIANALRDDGHTVEIHTRKRGSYAPKDFDAMPERGDAQ